MSTSLTTAVAQSMKHRPNLRNSPVCPCLSLIIFGIAIQKLRSKESINSGLCEHDKNRQKVFCYFQTVTLLIVSSAGIINGVRVQGSPRRIVMLSIALRGGGIDK